MDWRLIILPFLLVCAGAFAGRKVVKIVQEPANYGGLQSQRINNQLPKGNSMLKPFRKPHSFSGPKHLQKLYGKCFSLTDKSYLYQLCPFFNITQHEQTWRWNAFQGILGIWKEWSIVNHTFEAMVMTEGDPCPGDVRRQSKIFLKCANKNKLVSVKEPKTCQYEVEFQTPLACPVDAFLVYPFLSREQQKDWEEIERGFYHQELTKQGYEKLRRNLFVRAGLLIPVEQSKVETIKDLQSTVTPAHSEFKTKDECSQAYSDLLHKYEKLVQFHKNQNSSTNNNTTKNSQISITSSNDLTRARGDHGMI